MKDIRAKVTLGSLCNPLVKFVSLFGTMLVFHCFSLPDDSQCNFCTKDEHERMLIFLIADTRVGLFGHVDARLG